MMAFSAEQSKALNAKLSPDHIKQREQGGKQLSYIEGWHVIAEANRIFGFDGWSRETVSLQETNRDLVTLKSTRGEYQQWRIGYIAKVRVTVGQVVREGTGYGSGMGKPEAVGDAVEGAIKEAETDAMKRALMTFGNPFGLALYDKAQENVGHEPVDRTIIDTLLFAMKRAENRDDLKAWGAGQKAEIDALPEAQRNEMKAAYSAFLRTLPETVSEAA